MRFWNWLKSDRAKPLRDIGSIVLGVLIALGIGEIADDIRWRVKVQDSEIAMRAELGSLRRTLHERMEANACVARRLDAIGAILQAARRGQPVPRVQGVGGPAFRLIETTAFAVAREEGVSLHMSRARWRAYATTYTVVSDHYDAFAPAERERWARLRLLESVPGVLDSDLLAALLVAWAEAKAYARTQDLLARQSDTAIAALDIPIDWTFDSDPGDPHSLAEQRADMIKRPICQALKIAPAA